MPLSIWRDVYISSRHTCSCIYTINGSLKSLWFEISLHSNIECQGDKYFLSSVKIPFSLPIFILRLSELLFITIYDLSHLLVIKRKKSFFLFVASTHIQSMFSMICFPNVLFCLAKKVMVLDFWV